MKIYLLILILFMSINCNSQNSKSIIVDGININENVDLQYLELVFFQKLLSFKVRCIVDYGQEFEWGTDSRVQDSSGQIKTFNSVIDGLNFFVNNGWSFVTTYPVSSTNSTVYHFLLKRDN